MIGISSDHGGFKTKEVLINYLSELGYDIKDYGTNSTESVDYPSYAFQVGEDVSNKLLTKGIVICTTGIGISIACNKVKGVRCAKADNVEEAIKSRQHNDANVIALAGINDVELNKEIARIFLETEFLNEERLVRRNEQIRKYENEH